MRKYLCGFAGLALAFSCAGGRPMGEPKAVAVGGVVDLHVHLTMARAAGPLFTGEPGDGQPLAANPDDRWRNMVDAEGLGRAGVQLVFAALWPPPSARPLEASLRQLEQLDAFTARRSRFVRVRNAAEARRLMARGLIATLPAVEGGEAITSVDDVDRLYAAGMRSLTLVHFTTNGLGGAASAQLSATLFHADAKDLREPLGLTPLGRQVVERLMDLGVIIDLAHASDALARDVLARTTARGVPVVMSHTAARALAPMERNVSDALALQVAQGGGLLGVSLYRTQQEVGGLATQPPSDWPGYQPSTCDLVVRHWRHLQGAAGPAAVVLGSDLNGPIDRVRPGGLCPDGLANTQGLPQLWGALAARGAPDVAPAATRVLAVWEAVERAADPKAQARALSQR